jgi:hypothetical protein
MEGADRQHEVERGVGYLLRVAAVLVACGSRRGVVVDDDDGGIEDDLPAGCQGQAARSDLPHVGPRPHVSPRPHDVERWKIVGTRDHEDLIGRASWHARASRYCASCSARR